jgi:beta-lactamase regulating signal transducer with metallopeptidase domain
LETNDENELLRSAVGIWLIGIIVVGMRQVVSHGRARRIVRRARITSEPALARAFTTVVGLARVRQRVQLRITREANSPAVAGILRPVVLLPVAAERWATGDVHAVLVHEIAHVSRHDCLINLISDVASAVYWCNPAAWFAVARLKAESESACDDRVLREGAEPDAYADLLLGIARTVTTEMTLPRAATAMARVDQLESRLLAVLDSRIRRDPVSRRTWLVLTAVGIVLASPVAALTRRAESTAEAPSFVVASQPTGREPDQLGDDLARPQSERVTLPPDAFRLSPQARAALTGPDSLLAQILVAALDHRPQHEADLIRERAAWALSLSRDGRLIDHLLEALAAPDWRVQAYAAWTIALTGEERAVERLVPLLDHPVWRLRAMAAFALRALHDPRAEPAMNSALTDPAWQVRREAVQYFAALGGPAVDHRISPRLDDRHVAVRVAAQDALSSR